MGFDRLTSRAGDKYINTNSSPRCHHLVPFLHGKRLIFRWKQGLGRANGSQEKEREIQVAFKTKDGVCNQT
jgi:hypothetical protein